MTPAFTWFLLTLMLRSVVVLVWVAVGLRLLGKHQLGQMNVYDLALVMALANAVQNAMTSGAGDLSVGFASAGALLIAGRAFVALSLRSPKLERRLVGSPTVLLSGGKIARANMARERVSEEELMTALRLHGLGDPREAKLAVLEVDGSISVVPADPQKRT